MSGRARVGGIVDAARLGILGIEFAPDGFSRSSLYDGAAARELADVAPYLLVPTDESGSDAHRAWHALAATESAILFRYSCSRDELRRHLRRLTVVMNERGQFLLFRYYDPRVLRAFLPIADESQLRMIFGPIDAFLIAEPTRASYREYRLAEGALHERDQDGAEIFAHPADS